MSAAAGVREGPPNDPEKTPNAEGDSKELEERLKSAIDACKNLDALDPKEKTKPEKDLEAQLQELLERWPSQKKEDLDRLQQVLGKLHSRCFVSETVLRACLGDSEVEEPVIARVWERTVAAREELEIVHETMAHEEAIKKSSPMHAVVILMAPDEIRNGPHGMYRQLIEFDWDAICGALCYMFMREGILAVKHTLKRICDFLLYLDSEVSSRVELDVETAEQLSHTSAKLQQTAVAMVEYLPDDEQEALWTDPVDGLDILQQFQLADARLFFARPRLQRILGELWHPHYDHESTREMLLYKTGFLLGCFLNLFLLMPAAFFPIVEGHWQTYLLKWDQEIRLADAAPSASASASEQQKDTWAQKREADRALRKKQKDLCWLWIRNLSPLLLPRQKKYLAIFTNLGFVIFLVVESSWWIIFPFIFSGGALYAELLQILGAASIDRGFGSWLQEARRNLELWLMDRAQVNIAEIIAYLFICISFGLRWAWESEQMEPLEAQGIRAAGIFFMGMSQGVSLLRLTSTFGPLVSMMVQMIMDMLRWVMLLLPILLSLVGAFLILFKPRSPNSVGGDEGDICELFDPNDSTLLTGVLLFFEIQIGKEAPFQCLENSRHSVIAPALLNFGLWIVMIMMLNMLIAMMAKTFDRIFEKSMVDYQYNFAGFVLQMRNESAVPPVLRLCSLPYTLFELVFLRPCRRAKQDRGPGSQETGTLRSKSMRTTFWQDVEDILAKETSEQQEPVAPADVTLTGVGETAPGKAPAAKKEPVPRNNYETSVLLSKLVDKFLQEHESDAAFQDEQFRRQVAQKLWKLDSHVEDVIDHFTIKTRRSYYKTQPKGRPGPRVKVLAGAHMVGQKLDRLVKLKAAKAATKWKVGKKPAAAGALLGKPAQPGTE